MLGQRHGTPKVVEMIVGRAIKDVEVGPTDSHRQHPEENLVGARFGARYIAQGEPPNVLKGKDSHQRVIVWSDLYIVNSAGKDIDK